MVAPLFYIVQWFVDRDKLLTMPYPICQPGKSKKPQEKD